MIIIRIKDRYFLWSTNRDAPVTYGLTAEQVRDHLIAEAIAKVDRELPERMERADKKGTSTVFESLEDVIVCNRAGENETTLTLDEIYEKYAVDPDED